MLLQLQLIFHTAVGKLALHYEFPQPKFEERPFENLLQVSGGLPGMLPVLHPEYFG